MEVDQKFTLYRHSAGTSTTWYKVTFYNSTTTDETAIADARPVRASISIDAAPASQWANSYATIDMANDYFLERSDTDKWDEATDQEKAKYLVEATRRIDSYNFKGCKRWQHQRLQWPAFNSVTAGGQAESSSDADTLVDSSRSSDDYYDNYWQYGGVRVTEGTNEHEVRLVNSYTHSTGTFEMETAFSSALDTTSTYEVIEPIPEDIREATYETALWLAQGHGKQQRSSNVKGISAGKFREEYFEERDEPKVPEIAYGRLQPYLVSFGDIRMV